VKKLFVGNVPYGATEGDLRDWFAQTGIQVESLNLVRDRYSGESRGFAFVEISNDEEAERAIQSLNGKDFMGRSLVVNEARAPREGGGFRGGGGGRGRGGHGGGRGGGRRRDW